MTRQKRLTKAQKESPHVVKMAPYYVFFSSAFINKFCVDYHAGKTANAILKDSGIDPKVLGNSLIETLRDHYRKNWLPNHADEPNRRNVTIDIAVNSKALHEIEYLCQEVNALKILLNRQFNDYDPREAFTTDITYLFYDGGKKRSYLSVLRDTCTHEVMSHVLSWSMVEDFVLETINHFVANYRSEISPDAIILSDQGIHYKCTSFT